MVAAQNGVCGARGLWAYGFYVDEVVAYDQAVGGVVGVYHPHGNHLYSVAALTGEKQVDGTVAVVERYTYDGYPELLDYVKAFLGK